MDWLHEGKHNCDGAQALLDAWVHDVRGSDNETLHDFFELLREEYPANSVEDVAAVKALPLPFLAGVANIRAELLLAQLADEKGAVIVEALRVGLDGRKKRRSGSKYKSVLNIIMVLWQNF